MIFHATIVLHFLMEFCFGRKDFACEIVINIIKMKGVLTFTLSLRISTKVVFFFLSFFSFRPTNYSHKSYCYVKNFHYHYFLTSVTKCVPRLMIDLSTVKFEASSKVTASVLISKGLLTQSATLRWWKTSDKNNGNNEEYIDLRTDIFFIITINNKIKSG